MCLSDGCFVCVCGSVMVASHHDVFANAIAFQPRFCKFVFTTFRCCESMSSGTIHHLNRCCRWTVWACEVSEVSAHVR